MRAIFTLPVLAMLAACGSGGSDGDNASGTSITLRSQNDNGQETVISGQGNSGEVSVKLPGFEGKMKLPKLHLDSDDFDLDGVNLYPGSTVDSMNINANQSDGKEASGLVNIGFTSPASRDTVQSWFAGKFADRGFQTQVEPGHITGTTSDGDRFDLKLTPAGADKTRGEMHVQGS